MHSFWNRLNALLTFAATVLAGMALCATFTDYLHRANPTVECSFSGVEGLQREFGHDRVSLGPVGALAAGYTQSQSRPRLELDPPLAAAPAPRPT